MNSIKTTIQEESLKIIFAYFGEKTARLYEKKFAGKTDTLISVMMRQLLGEYLGQEETEKHMHYLHKIINNHENK